MSSPDCKPDPTFATCPECGLDHPIGTPHPSPSLADTEPEERWTPPAERWKRRADDERERAEAAESKLAEAIKRVRELEQFIEPAEGGYGK